VTLRISPGPPATPKDRLLAQERYRLLNSELTRIRTAALAWRNGVAGLLAGLVGFGLIRGRTDVGELARPYDVVVGVLLLLALASGTVAALLLLRAAHGRTAATAMKDLQPGASADHAEALSAARALTTGLGCSLGCAALLVAAVGTTWYGPAKAKPKLEVVTAAGAVCGTVTRLQAGTLTLKTDSGEIGVNLMTAMGARAVDACSSPSPSVPNGPRSPASR
jgi:hypothetical protein